MKRFVVRWLNPVCACCALSAGAFAQSSAPAVFVSNNGNLEGSVTSFRLESNHTLTFLDRNITGTRQNINDPCPGCNAYDLSLTPDGRFLAVAHAAGDIDSITIHAVQPDGTINPAGAFVMPTPIDCAWISNDLLAVIQSDFSPDRVVVFRYDDEAAQLTQIDQENAGSGSSYLAVHPTGNFVYANDSIVKQVFAWRVEADGTLTPIDTESVGAPFPLELAVSPNGLWMYSAGGISDGGNKVIGLNIAVDGTLTNIAGSPFISPGASPSNVYVGRDNMHLFVGHGTDATVRVLAINQSTGATTDTGKSFDVGLQGTLGDVSTAPGGLMFVTDNSMAIDGVQGIYSFSVATDGSLTQNGGIYSTQGIAPRSIAVWTPPPQPPACAGDLDGNGDTDSTDLNIVLTDFGCAGAGCPGDADGDQDTDSTDLNIVLTDFGCAG